ncbi:MAG: CHASE2 domain-containing protein [Desulfobacterales bacterium]
MSLKPILNNDKRYVFLLFLCIVTILLCEDAGLFEGINNYCYDTAFRLRGKRSHADYMIIAAIDEKTLAKLGKWPIRRSCYADLLDKFEGAAAVGIDIIFSEASKDDAQLSQAIARQKRVVLPVYIESGFNISAPVETLSPAGLGHVHLEQGIDGIVRQVFHTISYGSVTLPSFSSVLDDVINGRKIIHPLIPPDLTQQKAAGSIFQSDNMWINFYGAPGTFQYLSVADILEDRWPAAFFADKVILVGKTTPGLNGGILVPFSAGRNSMPAVEVHAHVLNNLLDNSSIQPVKPWIGWALTSFVAIFCFFVFIRVDSLRATAIGSLILLAIALITFFIFSNFSIWLFPASFSLRW